jgi:hypothetical protein
MEVQIVSPKVDKSIEKALTVTDVVKSLVITNLIDYRFGQELMGDIKDRIKELTDERMDQTRLLDQSKAKTMAVYAIPLQKLNDAKNYLNIIMVKEEKKLQELARKRAEEEALQAALEAEAAGDKEEAEQIIAEPVYVPPIKVMSEIPKSKESHIRETWSSEGYDLMATVKAIADGRAPLQSVEYDMTFLNGQARNYKQALNIPGVKAISKKTQL